MNLKKGQHLFNALKDVCNHTALDSDMDEILRAVEKDNPSVFIDDQQDVDEKAIVNACIHFRRDYGLLTKAEKERLQCEAEEWLDAWRFVDSCRRLGII